MTGRPTKQAAVSTEPPLVTCPACGRLHIAHLRAEPHYCSIVCYRAGHGLDDPMTGDGRRYCDRCRRYIDPAAHAQRHTDQQGGGC
jgi:hypothetical protein